MKWITREKIKVDRVACPWLIKKFIDRDPEFAFLSHDIDRALAPVLSYALVRVFRSFKSAKKANS
jgi:hypothetical protein